MKLKINQELAGRYRVVEHFTNGSFGPLYLVENLRVPVRSILKVNLPLEELAERGDYITPPVHEIAYMDHIKRSQNEAAITARLNHPNIIKVTDVVELEGGKYIGIIYEQIGDVMELGQVIEDRFQALEQETHQRPSWYYPDPKLYSLFRQLRSAAIYLQKNGILHKDIKPANVLVDSNSVIKVVDFGIGCAYDEPNGMFGNRFYSPPEYYEGTQHRNSDLWSFGMLGFELLTGIYLLARKDKAYVEEQIGILLRDKEDQSPFYYKMMGFVMHCLPYSLIMGFKGRTHGIDFDNGIPVASWQDVIMAENYLVREVIGSLHVNPERRFIEYPHTEEEFTEGYARLEEAFNKTANMANSFLKE
jgi:serine/threonine protein kinase